jgi:hypothetical protein
MAQAATFFTLGIAMLVVVLWLFMSRRRLMAQYRSNAHASRAKVRTISSNFFEQSSKKFEEVRRKVRTFCSKNFELFRIVRKRKTFWNLFDFCEIFHFFEKNRTFHAI